MPLLTSFGAKIKFSSNETSFFLAGTQTARDGMNIQ